ncbi:MAG: hypothetical protein RLZZ116_1265 [Planctomycetota bacterium]
MKRVPPGSDWSGRRYSSGRAAAATFGAWSLSALTPDAVGSADCGVASICGHSLQADSRRVVVFNQAASRANECPQMKSAEPLAWESIPTSSQRVIVFNRTESRANECPQMKSAEPLAWESVPTSSRRVVVFSQAESPANECPQMKSAEPLAWESIPMQPSDSPRPLRTRAESPLRSTPRAPQSRRRWSPRCTAPAARAACRGPHSGCSAA